MINPAVFVLDKYAVFIWACSFLFYIFFIFHSRFKLFLFGFIGIDYIWAVTAWTFGRIIFPFKDKFAFSTFKNHLNTSPSARYYISINNTNINRLALQYHFADFIPQNQAMLPVNCFIFCSVKLMHLIIEFTVKLTKHTIEYIVIFC